MSDDAPQPTPGDGTLSDTKAARKAAPRRRRRAFFYPLYVCYVAGLVWLGLKAYWYFQFDVPFDRDVNADDVWQVYYPELWNSGAVDAELAENDKTFDVLLLGASVLEQTAGEIEQQLKSRWGDRLRVFNLAVSAHTTRDSYQKFDRLRDKRFDLIVVYHGINDVRMNCCAADDFRDDYTHCSWYASFQRRIKAGSLFLQGVTADAFSGKIGLGAPDEDMLDAGGEIKTANAFRGNVESIVQVATANGTPVVLMTFAYHIPSDYSKKKFLAGKLDFGDGSYKLAAEVWGRPRHVAKTIDAHNLGVLEIRKRHPDVLFVDQQELLSQTGRYFSDPCHLTPAGIEQFVANLLPAIDGRFGVGLGRASSK